MFGPCPTIYTADQLGALFGTRPTQPPTIAEANQAAGIILAARVRAAKARMGERYLFHPANRVQRLPRGPVQRGRIIGQFQ